MGKSKKLKDGSLDESRGGDAIFARVRLAITECRIRRSELSASVAAMKRASQVSRVPSRSEWTTITQRQPIK
jgi:hypothetical protein